MAFERRDIVETIVACRPRDELAPLPIAQSPAHVFARDPGHRREITLAELVADQDAPRAVLFAEQALASSSRARARRDFTVRKLAAATASSVSRKRARQHVHKILVDFGILFCCIPRMPRG